jgi:ESCRT-I complex subunit TSG101
MELKGSVDPDELLQPFDNLSKQIVNLHSRQLAIEDAMYYLERALASSKNNSIDTATFLREIRSLAREQFLCKSHLMKINATIDQKLATGGGV